MKIAMLQLVQTHATNCYLFVDENTGDGFLVDPAAESPQIEETLSSLGLKDLKYILLTHGHYDHILGVPYVKSLYPDAKIVISKGDEAFLKDPSLSLASKHRLHQTPMVADLTVKEGDRLPFGSLELTVMETPGHTRGSVIYLLEDIMIAGDTVFQQSYGRTDLPTGSMEEMQASLHRIGRLEGDYKILPGHGDLTMLSFERMVNPYMR